MNKVLISLSFILASSFLLPSCKASDGLNGKIPTHKVEGIDSYVRIQSKNELQRIAYYDSALILVDEAGCTACKETLPLIVDYIKENENLIYVVDYSSVYVQALNDPSNLAGSYEGLFPNLHNTPSYLYYHQGKLVDAMDGNYAKDTLVKNIKSHFVDIDYYSLNTFVYDEDPAYEIPYYVVDKDEDLDIWGYDDSKLSQKVSESNALVVFSWRQCLDCQDFYDSFFYSYVVKHPTRKFYYFEVDGYYLKKRSSDEATAKEGLYQWSDFSKKYHLTDYEGFIDNYKNPYGVVPTIVSFKKDSYSIFVYRNSGEVYRNEKGKLQYGRAFLKEVLALESDTSVKENDTESSNYQKALAELEKKALSIEKKKMEEFFDEEG